MEAVRQTSKPMRAVAASNAVSRKAAPGLSAHTEKPEFKPTKVVRLQPKLKVNKPGDAFEREADATADKVMRMSNVEQKFSSYHEKLQTKRYANAKENHPFQSASGVTKTTAPMVTVQRKCKRCEEEEKKLHRKENTGTEASAKGDDRMHFVEKELLRTKGGGQPLPDHVATFMSKRMNADFGAVRIHTSANAVAMNKALKAQAFTHGRDIYFDAGMYDPESTAGKYLLAHELTHVVQQGHAKPLEAKAAAPQTATASVQRFSLDDLTDIDPLSISIDDLVRKFAPELIEIKNAGGILPWLEEKINGAVDTLLNTFTGPIKAAIDFVSSVSPTFAKIINWIKTAGIKISKNDCSSFTELGTMIEQFVDELTAPAIEKIKAFAEKASAWCSDLWQKFGVPVWEFIKSYYGAQWEFIKNLGNTIWQKTAPIREWAESVWIRFKNWLGIGEGPDGQNGIIQWIEKKITDLWTKIKEKVEPYKKQLLVIGGVLLLLSPAGPLIAAGALFAGVITAVNWIRKNIKSPDDIVKLRVKFEKEILPALMHNLQSAAAALKTVFGSLTGSINSVLGAFGKLAGMAADGILSILQAALQWVTDKLTELSEVVTNKLTELSTWLQGIFDKLRAFITVIIQFLEKVSTVASKIMDLPILILGGLWKMIPSCIRVPIENFLINVVLKKVPFFEDVVAIVGVWQKMKKGAMDIIKTVFITGDLRGGILKAFKLFLDVLNIPVQLVIGIYEKAKSAFDKIVNKPKVIFSSIVSAIKAGFQKFYKNFLKNSLDAAGNWIFSKVKGIKMPKEFTIKSIFGLVLDILGLTEDNIFKRIEKKTSKGFADKLRAVYNTLKGAAAWVIEVLKDPKAAYEKAKKQLANLKTKLFESIGAWIAESVIGKFIAEMVAMMASTPFGQAIEAIVDTYKMIKTAIEYAEKVLRVVDSVLDSILDLAAGVIVKAVDTVEKGLVIGLEVSIAFIAKVIGLGDLPQQVKKIIEEDIRPLIDGAIDAVIDGVIAIVKTLKEFAGDVKEAIVDAFNWSKTKVSFTGEDGEAHAAYFEKKGAKPVLMVASDPKPKSEFLKEYRFRNKNNSKKLSIADKAEEVMTTVEEIAGEISRMDALLKTSPEAQKGVIQKGIDEKLSALLVAQTTLTLHLAKMLQGQDYTKYKSIYEIEGSVGIHKKSPKSASAKFAADHQPSNIMLEFASQNSSAPDLLKKVVAGRSALGFTIVLGDYRHYAGRTYGSKARPVADQFVAVVNELFKGESAKRKVILLEQALKDAAIRDAEQMEAVVSKTDINAPQWQDIKELDISDEDKQKLRQDIESQVKSGERLIKSTHISLNVEAY